MKKQPTNQPYLRKINRHAVFDLLRVEPLSSAEIAKRLGLSVTAIAKITSEMVKKKLLIREQASVEKGRPPQILRINPNAGLVAAIDFSTENVLIVLSDLSGRIIGRDQVNNSFIITDTVLFEVVERLTALCSLPKARRRELLTIYVASPGKIDDTSGEFVEAYRFAVSPSCNLKTLLLNSFNCRVFIKNDVKLSIEGELRFGKLSSETKNALMFYADAGVGTALMLNGEIYEGNDGFAGEIESFTLHLTDSYSTNKESLSLLLTLPGMVKRYNKALSSSDYPTEQHKASTFEDLLTNYLSEEATAVSVVHESARILGRMLYNLCSFLNLNTVVINGGITAFGDRFLQPVNDMITELSHGSNINLMFSGLKERAAVVGALALAKADAQDTLLSRIDEEAIE